VAPPTAEQERNINRAVSKMGDRWLIDEQTKEIKRKSVSSWRMFLDFFSWRRYSIWELYWFIKHERHYGGNAQNLRGFRFPIRHDNIAKPEGIPFIYQLQGGWNIPSRDLRVLNKGPLISEDGTKTLVEANIKSKQIINLLVTLGKFILQIVGLIASLIGIYQFIQVFM